MGGKNMTKGLTRHDTADRDFIKRIRQAFVTAEQAERHLTGAGTGGGAEAARLEMLRRHWLIPGRDSAAARERMIARRNRA